MPLGEIMAMIWNVKSWDIHVWLTKIGEGSSFKWQSTKVTSVIVCRWRNTWANQNLEFRCSGALVWNLVKLFYSAQCVVKKSTMLITCSKSICWLINLQLKAFIHQISVSSVWRRPPIQRSLCDLCLPAGLLPGHHHSVLLHQRLLL